MKRNGPLLILSHILTFKSRSVTDWVERPKAATVQSARLSTLILAINSSQLVNALELRQ